MAPALISLTGAPGSGKTTIARLLARSLGAALLEEDYASNPFLAESYGDREDCRLAAQSWFLLSRVNQLAAGRLGAGLTVADYSFDQDAVYAEVLLDDADHAAYASLAAAVAPLATPPRLVVLLDGSPELLSRRVADRGRRYEETFTPEFLARLAAGCRQAARRGPGPLIEIDIDARDLLADGAIEALADRVRRVLQGDAS